MTKDELAVVAQDAKQPDRPYGSRKQDRNNAQGAGL